MAMPTPSSALQAQETKQKWQQRYPISHSALPALTNKSRTRQAIECPISCMRITQRASLLLGGSQLSYLTRPSAWYTRIGSRAFHSPDEYH